MKRRFRRDLAELLFRLRTEADTPVLQAVSLAIGAFIGCLPVYGLHLGLCVLVGSLLRLNRLSMYLAANLNNPLVAPLLVAAEIQTGACVLHGAPYPLTWSAFATIDLRRFVLELAVGSAIVGAVVAVALGFGAYRVMRRARVAGAHGRLLEQAARPYLEIGLVDWEFVRGKLRYDPAYAALVAGETLPAAGELWDLGCGRGILLALLRAAAEAGQRSTALHLHGLDASPRAVKVARAALGEAVDIRHGDLTAATIPRADAFVVLDVLHYLPAAAQRAVLARCAAAVAPGGVVVVREVDLAGGWRSAVTRAAERVRAVLRGAPRQRLVYRGAAAIAAELEEHGLTVSRLPMQAGTPFANQLIVARAPRPT